MGQASPPLDPVHLFLPLPSTVHFQHRGWNDHLKMYIRSCPSSVTFLHASGVAQSQGPSACSSLAPGGTCCLCQLALLQPHLLPLLSPSSHRGFCHRGFTLALPSAWNTQPLPRRAPAWNTQPLPRRAPSLVPYFLSILTQTAAQRG